MRAQKPPPQKRSVSISTAEVVLQFGAGTPRIIGEAIDALVTIARAADVYLVTQLPRDCDELETEAMRLLDGAGIFGADRCDSRIPPSRPRRARTSGARGPGATGARSSSATPRTVRAPSAASSRRRCTWTRAPRHAPPPPLPFHARATSPLSPRRCSRTSRRTCPASCRSAVRTSARRPARLSPRGRPLPASPSTCALSSDRLVAALPSVLLVPRCAEFIDFRAAAGLCGWRRAARRVCARLRLSRPQRQRRRLGAPEPRRRPTPRRAHSVRRASGRSTVPYGRPATLPDGRWLARWQQGMTLTANSSIIPS